MIRAKGKEPAKIPKFNNIEEAAAFWDTHSPLDYPENFKEVKVRFDRPLIKRGLTIKLSEETIKELKALADAQGIGPSTLARMWLLERLKAAKERPTLAR